jgi:hypothetical protein
MSSGMRAIGLPGVHRCEEGTYRVGDCAGGPPGHPATSWNEDLLVLSNAYPEWTFDEDYQTA